MYAAEIKTPLFMHTNHPPVEATMLQDSCDCFTLSKASLHANQQSKPQPCSSLNIPPQTQCSRCRSLPERYKKSSQPKCFTNTLCTHSNKSIILLI